MKFKIVFMGTPEFAVPALKALHKNHEVLCVFTQPDKPAHRGLEKIPPAVKLAANECGLPLYQPEKITQNEIECIRKLQPDFLVVAAYGHILKSELLEIPKINSLNIHSSLLPRWRGAAPIQWAILSGDLKSGVSIMKMVARLDAGEVYGVKETEISNEDNAQTLHDRLSLLGAEALLDVLLKYATGKVSGVLQDEQKVTYAKKLTKDMEVLDPFNATAIELDRTIRALTPWPGSSIFCEKIGRIKIKKAKIGKQDEVFSTGELFEKNMELFIGTENGALQILVLQEEGKKQSLAVDFINGLRGRGISFPLKINEKGPL